MPLHPGYVMMVCAEASTAQVRTRSVDENMVNDMVDCARFGAAMSVRTPNSCDRLRAAPVRFPLFKFLVFSLVSHQIPFRITALRRSRGLCKWRRLGCYRPPNTIAVGERSQSTSKAVVWAWNWRRIKTGKARKGMLGNGRVISGGIDTVRPVPSSLQPPRPATTTNIALPPAQEQARNHNPNSACRRPPTQSGRAFWQQQACRRAGHSEAVKLVADGELVHADPPAPCHPETLWPMGGRNWPLGCGRVAVLGRLQVHHLANALFAPGAGFRAITNVPPIGGRTAWFLGSTTLLLRTPCVPDQAVEGPCLSSN